MQQLDSCNCFCLQCVVGNPPKRQRQRCTSYSFGDHKKVPKQNEDTGNLQILLHLRSLFWLHGIAFVIIPFALCLHTINCFWIALNSQNGDLKCNRICNLPASSSCLSTFLWSLFFFLNYQFLHYSFFSFLCPFMYYCNGFGLLCKW